MFFAQNKAPLQIAIIFNGTLIKGFMVVVFLAHSQSADRNPQYRSIDFRVARQIFYLFMQEIFPSS